MGTETQIIATGEIAASIRRYVIECMAGFLQRVGSSLFNFNAVYIATEN